MKKIAKWFITFAIIATVLIAFSIYQTETHPLTVSTITQEYYQQYLVKGVKTEQTNVTIGKTSLTMFVQLVAPKGNVSNGIPFLFEINIIIASNTPQTKQFAMSMSINQFSLNQSILPIKEVDNSILHGRVFQSVYSSVSVSQPMTYSSILRANVTINFYSSLGPYYVLEKSIMILL